MKAGGRLVVGFKIPQARAAHVAAKQLKEKKTRSGRRRRSVNTEVDIKRGRNEDDENLRQTVCGLWNTTSTRTSKAAKKKKEVENEKK